MKPRILNSRLFPFVIEGGRRHKNQNFTGCEHCWHDDCLFPLQEIFQFSMPDLSISNNFERRDLPSVIKQSAQRTGVDFNYLVAQAQLESGLRPNAEAKTSSATGLYQFIEQTWLGLVKEKGQEYGIGWAQNAISQDSKGRLSVANKSLKSSILELRKDPALAANLAGEFARDNGSYLEEKTGRKPESVDLYLAHF